MWAFYEYPDTTFEDLCIPFNFPTLRTKARFCAIPSTSGTATEVTAFSVITDYKKGVKYPLADFNITPDIAIVDPDLAETMPQKLTAHTGMDALTHAVEAYVSTLHCDYTDPLALHAIKMVHNDLIDSYNGDKEARARMHNAQCPEAAKRYADIARFIDLKGNNDEELVHALIAEIRSMNEKLNIPACIKDYEGGIIDEAEFNEKLGTVAELAVGDACTGSNPRPITAAEMEKLLSCCYYDKEVDF